MFSYFKKSFLYLILTWISLLSLSGAIVYRIYALNGYGIAISILLAIISGIAISFFLVKSRSREIKFSFPERKNKIKNLKAYLFPILYLFLYIIIFYVLFLNRTDLSITSPWQVIPHYFFTLYAALTLILVLAISAEKIKLSILLISSYYFLTFSIAAVIYKIGYGFDPFIHQATIDLINKTGSVEPKPFYYLGQYALEIFLLKATHLPLIWIDKLLVPFMASFFIPVALWHFVSEWFGQDKKSLILLISILALPLTFLIVTTPQNLAYIFLILTILYGLTCKNIAELTVVYIFALTALFIHPLAGIPALFAAIAFSIHYSEIRYKKIIYCFIFICSTLSLPLAFYILNRGNKSIESLASPFWTKLIIPNNENSFLNFIYLYGLNLKYIILALAVLGIFLIWKHRFVCKPFFIPLFFSISFFIGYFAVKTLPFNFLVDYEREDYANRLLIVSALFLLPVILSAFYALIRRIRAQDAIINYIFLVFFMSAMSASLYLTYPRIDNYFNSRGLSTGKNDIEAVHLAENDSKGNNYIVLANQQVSAAALREFGFNRYYKNSVYFYPIPTGGPLYQYYLSMVYEKPDRTTMDKAMELAGVNESYFILNKYWWASKKIADEAKLQADSWQEVGNGDVLVFKYKR